jgi:hypothetical protein
MWEEKEKLLKYNPQNLKIYKTLHSNKESCQKKFLKKKK